MELNIYNSGGNAPLILNDFLNERLRKIRDEEFRAAILIGSRPHFLKETNLLISHINSIDAKCRAIAVSLDSHINGDVLKLEHSQESELHDVQVQHTKEAIEFAQFEIDQQTTSLRDLRKKLTITTWSYALPIIGVLVTILAEIAFNARSLQRLHWSYFESLAISGALAVIFVAYGYVVDWATQFLARFPFIGRLSAQIILAIPLAGVLYYLAHFRVSSDALVSEGNQMWFFVFLNIVFYSVISYLVHEAFPSKEQIKLSREIKALEKELANNVNSIKEAKDDSIKKRELLNASNLSKAAQIGWLDKSKHIILSERDCLINDMRNKIIEMNRERELPQWLFDPIPPLDLNYSNP